MPSLIPLLPLLLAAPPALEDLAALDARLAVESGDTAAPLDRRLRLARCPAPPVIAPAARSGLEIACPALGWRLQVPVLTRGSAAAGQSAAVIVQRGESVQVSISGEDFSVEYRAVAVDAGRLGDTVRVRFSGTASPMAATVSGPGKLSMID